MTKKKVIVFIIILGLMIPTVTAVNYFKTELKNENYQYNVEGIQISSDTIFSSKTNEIKYDNLQLFPSQQKNTPIDSTKGWPATLDTFAILSSPVAYDFDNDGSKEVIITTFGDASNPYGSGKVYILSSDGDFLPGWPYNTTGPCPATPAIGDLDNDGIVEIVVTCWNNIFVFHFDGTIIWQKYDSGISSTTPVLADVDLDGNLDVVLTVRPGKICVWDSAGNFVSGWPITIDPTFQYELSTPVVGDIDQDGYVEIVVNTEDDETYVFNHDGSILTGWPVILPNDPDWWASVNRPPALGDVDDDGDIEIIRDAGDLLIVYESDGTISSGWPQSIVKYGNNGFALGLIDDQVADIVFSRTYMDGYLYAFHGDGTNVAGFPVNLAGKNMLTPSTIADIDGDGQREIVTRTQEEIYVFNHDGSIASGWPQAINDAGHLGTINPAPLITDLEGDGDIELVVPSCFNTVYVFDVTGDYNYDTVDWPVFQHDLYHTGLFSMIDNNPPTKPIIYGPTNGAAGELYEYSFVSTDDDGDEISYIVDWGDNTSLETYGPEESGVEVVATHTWGEQGIYQIKVKAKDTNGLESDWAILEVEMPVNQIKGFFVLELLMKRFPNAFLIFQHILKI